MIAAGLSVSNWMATAAEEMIYEGTFVEKHCAVVGGPEELRLPCPASGSLLAATELRRTLEDASNRCLYEPYWEVSRTRVVDDRTIPPSAPYPQAFPCPDPALAENDAAEPVAAADTGISEAEPVPVLRYPVERLPFEVSLDLSVARQFEVVDWRARRQLELADQVALRQSRGAGAEAREVFGAVPQTPGITIAACEWYDLKCQIVGMVKRSLINAYVHVRTRAERAFVNEMQERADGLASGVTATTENAEEVLGRHVELWSNATRESIASVFTVYRVLNVLAVLWLIVIGIKSFLYVFGRVVFDRTTDVHVDLADEGTVFREGKVTDVNEVTIPGDYAYDIYYKSNYQPLGPAPRFSIPQALASILSRIRYGAWNLSRITMPCDDERGLTFNSVQADYLVDWQLEEGEEVVFSYKNFVAMNENVELRTIVSLRVSSILLGRFVFHSARCKTGPGRLVLRTRGRPATAEQVRRSIPMSRLIAWNSFARFSVDSHLTHARDGGVLFGTLRFAKHFLLPV